jgi:hypothetical protein
MRPDATTYRLLDGHGLLIAHGDDLVRLRAGESMRRPAEPTPDVELLPLAA